MLSRTDIREKNRRWKMRAAQRADDLHKLEDMRKECGKACDHKLLGDWASVREKRLKNRRSFAKTIGEEHNELGEQPKRSGDDAFAFADDHNFSDGVEHFVEKLRERLCEKTRAQRRAQLERQVTGNARICLCMLMR